MDALMLRVQDAQEQCVGKGREQERELTPLRGVYWYHGRQEAESDSISSENGHSTGYIISTM